MEVQLRHQLLLVEMIEVREAQRPSKSSSCHLQKTVLERTITLRRSVVRCTCVCPPATEPLPAMKGILPKTLGLPNRDCKSVIIYSVCVCTLQSTGMHENQPVGSLKLFYQIRLPHRLILKLPKRGLNPNLTEFYLQLLICSCPFCELGGALFLPLTL